VNGSPLLDAPFGRVSENGSRKGEAEGGAKMEQTVDRGKLKRDRRHIVMNGRVTCARKRDVGHHRDPRDCG
jgi:hypothetical protein